jgi:diguanylate cyclase (GGDEF)-like protein
MIIAEKEQFYQRCLHLYKSASIDAILGSVTSFSGVFIIENTHSRFYRTFGDAPPHESEWTDYTQSKEVDLSRILTRYTIDNSNNELNGVVHLILNTNEEAGEVLVNKIKMAFKKIDLKFRENVYFNVRDLNATLFELLTDEKLGYDEEATFLSELIQKVKKVLDVQDITYLSFNKWKEQYVPQYSTNEKYIDDHNQLAVDESYERIVCGIDTVCDAIYPLTDGVQAQTYGVIVFHLYPDQVNEEFQDLLKYAVTSITKTFEKSHQLHIMEEKRYEQLYRVTSKFHSSMDMDDVLVEIFATLSEVYPAFSCYLLLSHDNNCNRDLPVIDLQYGEEATNKSASQAYLTGETQFEDIIDERVSVLYAPLKGKQGIYGVLQVKASDSIVFPKEEVGFITLLANTAGSALENAKLYQQSQRLISDLQLINETSHRLNSNLRLAETINFMTEQITTSFRAEEVGFYLYDKGTYDIMAGSTSFFSEGKSLDFLSFITKQIKSEDDSLFYGNLTQYDNNEVSFRSCMAIPMVLNDLFKGAVVVLHSEPYQFSFENFKLLQSLIHHSTLAFTNSMLREELEKLVITDHLTKLKSRNFLDERVHKSMQEDGFGTFLLIDIDNFKAVNDTYGHQVGDDVIIQVSNILKNNIRENDIGARWGGEELAVYFPNVELETGIKIAERLVMKVREETKPPVTISCGIAHWGSDKCDVQNLVHSADKALYEAKKTGKNRLVVHSEDKK